jgi:hypothetical protein
LTINCGGAWTAIDGGGVHLSLNSVAINDFTYSAVSNYVSRIAGEVSVEVIALQFSLSAPSDYLFDFYSGGYNSIVGPVTLTTGTAAFDTACIGASNGATVILRSNMVNNGLGATGKRFELIEGSRLITDGVAEATALLGDAAGTAAAGSGYY